jgi:hypothetical protein
MQFHSACVNVISVTTNLYKTGKCPTALGTGLDSYMEIMYRRYGYFQENHNPFLQTSFAFNFNQFGKKIREQAISNMSLRQIWLSFYRISLNS